MSTEPNRSFVETITFFCAAVPPLRLLLVVFSVPVTVALVGVLTSESAAHDQVLSFRSLAPSLGLIAWMVMMFDVMMLAILRRSRTPPQRRVDNGFGALWLCLCAIITVCLAVLMNLRLS
ncbi:MAG: hypothetical protein K0U66_09045 [Gammaproteobacteria bacterium]|nr:hypothetical protein [Pseudomonadota bacterium]MCH9663782.1 hypothetical protein [Gammaproteobacteria bacterium]